MQAASSAGGARAGAADAPPAAREPNAYEARIARLIASLPPEEVSTDLRALGEARALVRAGVDALTDAAAALPALAQGAVDLFRGLALQDAVSGSRGVTIDVSSMERAIRRAGGAPYELDGRMKLDVLRAALLQSYANLALARFMQVQARGEVLGSLAAELERAKAWLGAVVAYWCQPGRAQAAAARLAALGVRGGEGVAADVVAVLLQAQTGGEMTVRGRLVWALMEQTCAACPLALTTAANLAVGLLETDAPQAYATALNALQRADAAGHDFQAARLLTAAALAVIAGALGGPTHRLVSSSSSSARGACSTPPGATCRARSGARSTPACASTRTTPPRAWPSTAAAHRCPSARARASRSDWRSGGCVRAAACLSWRRASAGAAARSGECSSLPYYIYRASPTPPNAPRPPAQVLLVQVPEGALAGAQEGVQGGGAARRLVHCRKSR